VVRWIAAVFLASALACSLDDSPPPSATAGTASPDDDGSSSGDPIDPGPDRASITHAFGGTLVLASGEFQSCVSWTLDNEEALYVQAVTLANESGFHHSNWFVVPDDVYDGVDGFWPCAERGYEELGAATGGTVLFAQSTQSWLETQRLGAGAVIKIPPHSRIVGGVHLLNLAPREIKTDVWMTLELLHPRWVATVVTPMQLSFLDLSIGAMDETRHDADCEMAATYLSFGGLPWDLKIHYVLPHFHELGNWFDLRAVGGPQDGESLYRLEGFDADANGQTYDPPLDLSEASGLGFTCGYDNVRSEDVGWGYGDQEMCVMLLLVESELLLEATVPTAEFVGNDAEGIMHRTGDCLVLGSAKSPLQSRPTLAEIEAPLYVPPTDPADADIPPVPTCEDADPEGERLDEIGLSDLRAQLFGPACSFGACHGESAAAGLDLTVPDLRTELLEHEPVTSGGIPLVTPYSPENSWLFRVLSECSPMRADGSIAAHMPLNAPVLLDDRVIATVRAWIEAGAQDN
jgi:hypothetical protein